MTITLPYDEGLLTAEIGPEHAVQTVYSELHRYVPPLKPEELIRQAMEHPIGSPPLRQLAKGKKRVVLIASDHTRPVPSRLLVPAMLEQIYQGNPDAQVTILIATGCHRGTTSAELEKKFGREILDKIPVVIHDSTQSSQMVDLGILPSGAPLAVNRLAAEADLLVAEGFIEPHFFAGFSGGRKSVLPGICSTVTVYANHCSQLIDHPAACCGSLTDNPVHRDMVEGARRAGLAFILNVVCGPDKQVIGAFAGDFYAAHLEGAAFAGRLCSARVQGPCPVVITSNGGYPLDQNIYQAVKSISTAARVCSPGGVIIAAAACQDGHGGQAFYDTFAQGDSPSEILRAIRAVPATQTRPDQWQSQILARVMENHRVILVSRQPGELAARMGLVPAGSLEEAIRLADQLLGGPQPLTVIPDGVGTITVETWQRRKTSSRFKAKEE